MQPQWIRSSSGFILVYSVDSRDSFEHLSFLRERIMQTKDVAEGSPDMPPIVIAANKCDLKSSQWEISSKEGQELAAKWGAQYVETSAALRIDNEVPFFQVIRDIRKQESRAKKMTPDRKKKKCNWV